MNADATDRETDLIGRAQEVVDRLDRLRAERDRAREAVASAGEGQVAAAADAYREAVRLLDGYEATATGTGNFEAYVEFQERITELVEGLDEDLPARAAFEAVAERMDQRRLSEADFAAAREDLEPAAEMVERLERRDDAVERYRRARHEAEEVLDAVEDRIADLERTRRLGEADLDAPVERLREPVETYDERVREAFDDYLRTASAREVFDLLATTRAFPLVDLRPPPRDLREYVETAEAGTEPLPTLLEYADYSASKLDHYVADPGALRAAVATHRTYIDRLDAEPLTVGWPPPPADRLRWRARELVAVVGRFADEATVASARRLRDLPDEVDYERLRETARARAKLDERERERLAAGEVESELAALREVRADLRAALT